MAYYDKITLIQCVESAKMQLQIDTTDYDIWMERNANEAVRHLDSYETFTKKMTVLEITDGKAELPCNYYKLLGVRTGSGDSCSSIMYVDLPFLSECGCTNIINSSPYQSIFEISNGWIHLHADLNDSSGDPLTEITIAYMALDTDDDGLMVVRSDYERAVVAYICWKHAMQFFNVYHQYIIEKYEAEWKAQKRWVKGNSIYNHFTETKAQVRESINAWVVQKRLTA